MQSAACKSAYCFAAQQSEIGLLRLSLGTGMFDILVLRLDKHTRTRKPSCYMVVLFCFVRLLRHILQATSIFMSNIHISRAEMRSGIFPQIIFLKASFSSCISERARAEWYWSLTSLFVQRVSLERNVALRTVVSSCTRRYDPYFRY